MQAPYRRFGRMIDTLVPHQLRQNYRLVRLAADRFRRRPNTPVQTGDSLRRAEIPAVEPHGNGRCFGSKRCGSARLDGRNRKNSGQRNCDDVNDIAVEIEHGFSFAVSV
jgi:hypothetical protein